MRILAIGDLHGIKPEIPNREFDLILAVGDFSRWGPEARKLYSIQLKEFLEDPSNYREWWQICGKEKAKELVEQAIESGREVLEFLDSIGKPVLVVPGNTDRSNPEKVIKYSWSFLNKDFFKERLVGGLKNVINIDRKAKAVGDYVFIGYGGNNGPELLEYRGYRNISKEELEENRKRYESLLQRYDKLFEKVSKMGKPIIFLSHNVPFNTALDEIKNKDSPLHGLHYGSLIVREMIEKYQPILNIAGHIHENVGRCKIGKTVCINPGSGENAFAWIELEGEKIEKIEIAKLKSL